MAAVAAMTLLFGGGCSRSPAQSSQIPVPNFPPPQPGAIPADDGQWTLPAKDYANTRFSALTEITTANVNKLRLAWAFSTGTNRGHEAQPLIVNNTMYYVTPFPNLLYALDLTKPGAPMKWKYDPKPSPASQGVACCDHVNRGACYWNGRIYYATLDNHVVAVDAATGAESWKTKVGEMNLGETITMAPLVVKGKVLVGNSGGEFGVRGWIKALDAANGQVLWTGYNTGPDRECLIGPNFKPFYAQDRGTDLGVTSWPANHWKIGGAAVWGWVSYDPTLDLIYYGTSNPGPWNPDIRPGDNKWSAAILARRPDTGEAIWGYQWTPHDVFDYDGINESILVDLNIGGAPRKVLLRAERNGLFYVMDRATGEVLSAEPYIFTNVVTSFDYKTGRAVEDVSKKPGFGTVGRNICPAVPGGKDWEPMAYSPKTGLVYIPAVNLCMDVEGVAANYIAGTPYTGHKTLMYAGPGGHRGEFTAWDPAHAKKHWTIKELFPVYSGALATAGDVVFYGTMDRWFKAVHAVTGHVLWQFRTGSGIISSPISYRGPDGRQYIAVADGVGGWAGSLVSAGLDQRDGYADKGFVNAMKDLSLYTGRGGTIYVFALP
jgi:PQQ-dependent dehydrogenase (methanol/ethanol family)